MTLAVVPAIQHRMAGWLPYNKWKGCARKWLWPNCSNISALLLQTGEIHEKHFRRRTV